jgi:hypothetical protein
MSPNPSDDPFFWLPENSEWNALIGRQGEEANYLDGYMQAALLLANTLIGKKLYGERDTLILPILYNARHAVELTLKFLLRRLTSAGISIAPWAKNHDIRRHWEALHNAELGDSSLRSSVAALEPFVMSLSKIDDDGQELRYHETREGRPSLKDYGLANIAVIAFNLRKLQQVLSALQHRLYDLLSERATGTFTSRCSRSDLLAITHMLPPHDEWKSHAFDKAKAAIRELFQLGSRQFSMAVDAIKVNRQMKALIGPPSELVHLTDGHAILAVQQWARRHPLREVTDDESFDYFDRDWEAFHHHMDIAKEVNEAILQELSLVEIADLQTIFYVGRDRVFCEYYETQVSRTANQIKTLSDGLTELNQVMEKTNFRDGFAQGLVVVGRPDLAKQIAETR